MIWLALIIALVFVTGAVCIIFALGAPDGVTMAGYGLCGILCLAVSWWLAMDLGRFILCCG